MVTQQELLFIHGFVKKGSAYKDLSHIERKKKLREADEETKHAMLAEVHEEIIESADGHFQGSGYPYSEGYQRLVWETAKVSVEDIYFWVYEHLRQDRAFYEIYKITDLYAASEASAFWGNQQQRIGAQQSNVQGLLANIGKFVKELFQMVRELRILDERLEMYESWKKKDAKGNWVYSDSADVTLKSLFTDQVEGGTKNPQSVFGLAQTVGFSLLPDLFFNTRVYSQEQLDKKLAALDINESNKNVLRRKLYQFLVWKEKTHIELKNRRQFNIRYLRQHWTIIKTYMNWAKPYLKNLQRLQMHQGLSETPDMISSFDQNLAEIEILCKREAEDGVHPVMIVNFQHRTRPDMNIRKEYQQGPTHMGRTQIQWRAFAWTQQQIDAYRAMRAQEGIELLGVLDDQLSAVMDGLGVEFQEYLAELEDSLPKPQAKEEKKPSAVREAGKAFEPFLAIFLGFWEIIEVFVPKMPKSKKKSKAGSGSSAAKTAKQQMHLIHHIFKKNRKMLSW